MMNYDYEFKDKHGKEVPIGGIFEYDGLPYRLKRVRWATHLNCGPLSPDPTGRFPIAVEIEPENGGETKKIFESQLDKVGLSMHVVPPA